MEFTERSIKIVDLGKCLIAYAYGLEYADKGDMNDLLEEKERLIKEFKELMEDF